MLIVNQNAICAIILLLPGAILFSPASFSPSVNANEQGFQHIASNKLRLVGTITGSSDQTFALIKNQENKVRFYTVGEKINGFFLKAIHRNYILLGRNHTDYTLPLQFKLDQLHPKEKETRLPPPNEIHIPIQYALLKHIRNNTQKWLSAITIRLQLTEGLMSGYVVESIGKIPYKVFLGLKQGDIIKAINGIPVGQSESFAKIVNGLLEVSDISMQIERDHKSHIINFNIVDKPATY